MAESFARQLQTIDWKQFKTDYGSVAEVPSQLTRLFSNDNDDAMEASHELWCGLCHQHAWVASAALPAFPFLIHALDALDTELVVEVLDILYGFSVVTGRAPLDKLPVWEQELRRALLAQSSRFATLALHSNEDVREWAEMIGKELKEQVQE